MQLAPTQMTAFLCHLNVQRFDCPSCFQCVLLSFQALLSHKSFSEQLCKYWISKGTLKYVYFIYILKCLLLIGFYNVLTLFDAKELFKTTFHIFLVTDSTKKRIIDIYFTIYIKMTEWFILKVLKISLTPETAFI